MAGIISSVTQYLPTVRIGDPGEALIIVESRAKKLAAAERPVAGSSEKEIPDGEPVPFFGCRGSIPLPDPEPEPEPDPIDDAPDGQPDTEPGTGTTGEIAISDIRIGGLAMSAGYIDSAGDFSRFNNDGNMSLLRLNQSNFNEPVVVATCDPNGIPITKAEIGTAEIGVAALDEAAVMLPGDYLPMSLIFRKMKSDDPKKPVEPNPLAGSGTLGDPRLYFEGTSSEVDKFYLDGITIQVPYTGTKPVQWAAYMYYVNDPLSGELGNWVGEPTRCPISFASWSDPMNSIPLPQYVIQYDYNESLVGFNVPPRIDLNASLDDKLAYITQSVPQHVEGDDFIEDFAAGDWETNDVNADVYAGVNLPLLNKYYYDTNRNLRKPNGFEITGRSNGGVVSISPAGQESYRTQHAHMLVFINWRDGISVTPGSKSLDLGMLWVPNPANPAGK